MLSADSQRTDELVPNVAGIESEVHLVALGHAPSGRSPELWEQDKIVITGRRSPG